MKDDPNKDHRHSIRLCDYDYAQAGAYFVTMCTRDRRCLFGDVSDGEIRSNDVGHVVQTIWEGLPSRFPLVELDQFVVMPNHVHGIIVLVGAQFIAPNNQGAINRAPTLGQIVRAFKAATTRQMHLLGRYDFRWQRNYYEHVIRNEDELDRVRQYILDNPAKWLEDEENPQNL